MSKSWSSFLHPDAIWFQSGSAKVVAKGAITFLMQSLAMVVPISALYESSCGGVFMSNAATFGGLKNLSAEGAVQV